jgi:hypothetical protein
MSSTLVPPGADRAIKCRFQMHRVFGLLAQLTSQSANRFGSIASAIGRTVTEGLRKVNPAIASVSQTLATLSECVQSARVREAT